MTYTLNTGN